MWYVIHNKWHNYSILCVILQKSKNKKKGKDDKYGSEVTTPENSSSPGMMDMHGKSQFTPYADKEQNTLNWCSIIVVNSSFFHFLYLLDDNSNQSSIADCSPMKQENSNSASPAPEATATSQSDSNEAKSDQSQSPGKEQLKSTDSKSGQYICYLAQKGRALS